MLDAQPRPRRPLIEIPGLGSEVHHVKRYEVRRFLGEGGMGRVYQAYDPVLERDVALKVVKAGIPEGERRRFRREAIVGARFCYPSIARIFDLGICQRSDAEWFTMEYLPGTDMAAVIDRAEARGKHLPLAAVADVFRQILAALQYAHDCRIVHRDVKPANMFVTRDPNTRFMTTKLLDFGVALDLDGPTKTEVLCGDPNYMAPEQTRFGADVDPRADIYAAGMSLYEVVTGRLPFEELADAPLAELLRAQRESAPLPPSLLLPAGTPSAVSEGLDRVFARACAKDPDDRYQSAVEMQEVLLAVLSLA
ncbi:MAG: serine/threonine protein kinase [Myxococcales bacterium]|nr:serine/threonine protein kinase [Myxococcales bacterium]